MEVENKDGIVVFKGDKSEVVQYLNANGYNIQNDTTTLCLAYLVRQKYSLYIRWINIRSSTKRR